MSLGEFDPAGAQIVLTNEAAGKEGINQPADAGGHDGQHQAGGGMHPDPFGTEVKAAEEEGPQTGTGDGLGVAVGRIAEAQADGRTRC